MANNRELSAEEKEQELIKYLRRLGGVLVGYSGGVDSTYLMAVAREVLGQQARAVLVKGAMIPATEAREAQELAERLDFPLETLDVDILALEEFSKNPPDRCYYCKTAIFSSLLTLAKEFNLPVVFDGTNFSDENDFRPGRRALQELGVISPLKEVGLVKEEIRELSRRRGLPTWDKPSLACLASRIPYGDEISEVLLKRVEVGEKILERCGFPERRVRIHGELARIEIPFNKFSLMQEKYPEVTSSLQNIGFRYVTLDLMGLRTGSLNPPGGLE
ncbi:MAG: ATP-dependent sacrificial sulfur transferase LarE [Desulfitobacteriaceae bacterium]